MICIASDLREIHKQLSERYAAFAELDKKRINAAISEGSQRVHH